MATSILAPHSEKTELILEIYGPISEDAYTLSLRVEELQERIKCLEEENACLSMRVELLQDLCLAE